MSDTCNARPPTPAEAARLAGALGAALKSLSPAPTGLPPEPTHPLDLLRVHLRALEGAAQRISEDICTAENRYPRRDEYIRVARKARVILEDAAQSLRGGLSFLGEVPS